MDKNNQLNLTEYNNFSNIFIAINKIGLVLIVLFIVVFSSIKRLFDFPIPNGIFFTILAFGLIMLAYLYLLSKKVKNDEQFRTLSFWYYMIVTVLITVVIHYLGALEGHAWFIYSFLVIIANITLHQKQGIMLTLWTLFCCASMLFLEYLKVIPHYSIFINTEGNYDNLTSLFTNLAGVIFLGFGFTAFISRLFSSVYKKISNKLMKTTSELEQARVTLEIRIQARTKELEELTQDLDRQVKERTKKFQEKVQELEKFQKLAVGREMKMIELKEEIKKLAQEKQAINGSDKP